MPPHLSPRHLLSAIKMASLPHHSRRWIDFGPERHLFSNSSILQGKPAVCKTSAELKFEDILQVANHSPGQPAQAKPGQLAATKPQDPKPRLLLMGLRR